MNIYLIIMLIKDLLCLQFCTLFLLLILSSFCQGNIFLNTNIRILLASTDSSAESRSFAFWRGIDVIDAIKEQMHKVRIGA